jgi:hypothetical protein
MRARPRSAAPAFGGCRHFGTGIVWVLVFAAIPLLSCQTRSPMRIRPGPVVTASREVRFEDALQKVAVMPFFPEVPTGRSIGGGKTVSPEGAALVATYFADALAAQGVTVIAPSDLATAFTAKGQSVPRQDPTAAAERAAADFGATAVVVGRVTRWREREGSAAGATTPASVAFEVTLYQAPVPRRLWSGRFDETQKSITEAILRARQYPGSGTRWLSTEEFARWGAQEVVKSMTGPP